MVTLEQKIEHFCTIGIPIPSQLPCYRDLEELDYPLIGEPRFNGIRAQVHVKQGEIKIFLRVCTDKTRCFPDIVKKVQHYPDGIYDGHIVISANCKADYVPFDLLHDGETPLLNTPLFKRRFILEDRIDICPYYAIHTPSEATRLLEACISKGYEGIVLKPPKSPYFPGDQTEWTEYIPH